MSQPALLPQPVRRLQLYALCGGIVGCGLCLLGFGWYPTALFRAYLFAWLIWMGLPLGCVAILMLHHLVGGAWGVMIQRILEAGVRTLPLIVLFAAPLVFGIDELYVWARPTAVANDPLLQHKSPYLNRSFFELRGAIYMLIWLLLAYGLNRWSRQQAQTANPEAARAATRRLQRLSALGLVLYALTVTFAAIDWGMSLDPHWYSTIYGVLFMVSQILATLAFVIVVVTQLADVEPLAAVLTPGRLHDLGKLLLAFVMLWAYCAFSQYLIIWPGNLPEETPWYLHRTQGGWQWLGLTVLIFHFILPFCLLLSRDAKRRSPTLAAISIVILGVHAVDRFWLIMPSFYPAGLHAHWLDLAAFLGIGGLWLATFLWQLQRRALVPLHDPRLQEVNAHG
jgi:hypothetical protein